MADRDTINKTLPYFKQFYGGGPNSMRGWPIRGLGPGSEQVRIGRVLAGNGDIQLEANLEYRFDIAKFSWGKLTSAVFVDVGNIWNRPGSGNSNRELALSKLYQQLAVSTGVGLIRLDFEYFLIRLDYGFRLKDPIRTVGNGWIQNIKFSDLLDTRNYSSLQIGVGLPF